MPKFIIVLLIFFTMLSCGTKEDVLQKPNVLFIAVDDLRPELGCYGSKIAVTPNIDQLAKEGLLFKNAYCQQAICSPSRASLMTGARPTTTKIIENYTYFRDLHPDIITLPQHFRANGYETVYSGKIYHGKFTDEEKSWSRSLSEIDLIRSELPGGYALKENQEIYNQNQQAIREKYGDVGHYALGRGPAYEMADVPDHTYPDGYNTELAIATMQEMGKNERPFFLGIGFKLPHLDWNAPKKYWDLYDRSLLPLTSQPDRPENGAAMGLHASFELRVRHGIPKSGHIEEELAKTLKHAYLASVSYVDALIGKMIKALDDAHLRDNTIIMLWSDHGWHLGDLGVWGKATNYEIATRVPLLVWTPDMRDQTRGKETEALVELVDMYPTLCDLAKIDKPDHLEGQSFVPLLSDPNRSWKKAAFTQYPNPALREWAANPLTASMRETYFGPLIEEVEQKIMDQQGEKWDRDLFENHLMGYAMRTAEHRLILWKDRRQPNSPPIFVELFDHQVDSIEATNIADDNPELVAHLIAQFNQGWQGSLAEVPKH